MKIVLIILGVILIGFGILCALAVIASGGKE